MENSSKVCWQYRVKTKNLENDLKEIGFSKEQVSGIKVRSLKFEYIDKIDIERCREIKCFIERHEWLGKMPARPTHRFVATYRKHIVGVVVMATPYGFTNIFGKENAQLEKLIARGATISWAPKHTGSWIVMKSIRWMVKNTQYRFFSGYSDTAANELGTVYQACNFIYLGKKSGTKHEFFDPENPQRGWFSDRLFRKVGQFRKYAKMLGYEWQISWNDGSRILWDNIPSEIQIDLRKAAIEYRERCQNRKVDRKHKYTYLKCPNRNEQRRLFNRLYQENPKLKPQEKGQRPGLPYPKERGA